MATFAYDQKLETMNTRDIEYGADGGVSVSDWSEEVSEDDKTEKLKTVKDEFIDARSEIMRDISDCTDLPKDDKKLLRKLFSRRLDKMQAAFEKKIKSTEMWDSKLELDDIDEEVDEAISKLKELANDLMDSDYDCSYGTVYGKGRYGNIYDYEDYGNTHWPKRVNSCNVIKTDSKDFSKSMKEIKSEKVLKLKFDSESFNSFLSESDGDLENIAVITSDNREYQDIENAIFKIKLIPAEFKMRRGAYTEANGKEISDALEKVNGTKCGWIHTHPFGKGAIFFSGTDDTTTKEMCVLPDDYCIAVVVACSYNEVSNKMLESGRVIKEYDLSFDLGKMVYRKAEIPKYEYDPKTDSLKRDNDMIMTKYDCEVVLVDNNGNEVELPRPDPDKFKEHKTDKQYSYFNTKQYTVEKAEDDDEEEPSYENTQFVD